MQKSESIAELAKALAAFSKEKAKIAKEADNPFFKSKYASLENILDAVDPLLAKHGLSVVQMPSGTGLATMLLHESGQWIEDFCEMATKNQNDPQAMGSAITYYRRYGIAAALCLNIGDDDDGNAAAPARQSPAPRPVQAARKPASAPERREDEKPEDGQYTVYVEDVKSGTTAGGKAWTRIKTEIGGLWWNDEGQDPVQGVTYDVEVRNGGVVSVSDSPF